MLKITRANSGKSPYAANMLPRHLAGMSHVSRLLVASCLLGAFGTGCARRTAPAPECLEATQLAAPDTALIAQQAPRELLDEIAADSTIHLVLNVPAFTVSVLSGDSVVRAYPVAVGSPRYPTRLGSFSIQTITWNPWWIPPESEWARNEQTTPPGPSNPMGKVKLNYTSAYYLHGTPDSTRLRRPVSHGCVRMQNRDVIELALIVQDASGVRLSAEEQEQLLTSWQHNRTLTLGAGVRLDVRYQLAVARDSFVVLLRDIYDLADGHQDDAVLAVLTAQGVDPAAIDTAAVAAFAERARRNGGAALMRSLLRDTP